MTLAMLQLLKIGERASESTAAPIENHPTTSMQQNGAYRGYRWCKGPVAGMVAKAFCTPSAPAHH